MSTNAIILFITKRIENLEEFEKSDSVLIANILFLNDVIEKFKIQLDLIKKNENITDEIKQPTESKQPTVIELSERIKKLENEKTINMKSITDLNLTVSLQNDRIEKNNKRINKIAIKIDKIELESLARSVSCKQLISSSKNITPLNMKDLGDIMMSDIFMDDNLDRDNDNDNDNNDNDNNNDSNSGSNENIEISSLKITKILNNLK